METEGTETDVVPDRDVLWRALPIHTDASLARLFLSRDSHQLARAAAAAAVPAERADFDAGVAAVEQAVALAAAAAALPLTAVAYARACGVPWDRIADRLGITSKAAQRRYTEDLRALFPRWRRAGEEADRITEALIASMPGGEAVEDLERRSARETLELLDAAQAAAVELAPPLERAAVFRRRAALLRSLADEEPAGAERAERAADMAEAQAEELTVLARLTARRPPADDTPAAG